MPKKTHEEFIAECNKIAPHIKILSKYKTSKEKPTTLINGMTWIRKDEE